MSAPSSNSIILKSLRAGVIYLSPARYERKSTAAKNSRKKLLKSFTRRRQTLMLPSMPDESCLSSNSCLMTAKSSEASIFGSVGIRKICIVDSVSANDAKRPQAQRMVMRCGHFHLAGVAETQKQFTSWVTFRSSLGCSLSFTVKYSNISQFDWLKFLVPSASAPNG